MSFSKSDAEDPKEKQAVRPAPEASAKSLSSPPPSGEKIHDLAQNNPHPYFPALIQSLPLPLAWKDGNNRYQGANTSFCSMLGMNDLRTIIGCSEKDLPWDESSRATLSKLTEEVFARQAPVSARLTLSIPPPAARPPEPSHLARSLHGAGKTYRVDVVPIFAESSSQKQVTGCSLSFLDISPQVAAEDARRKSETRFQAMLNRIPVIVWTVDHDLLVTPHVSQGLPAHIQQCCNGEAVPLQRLFPARNPNATHIVAVKQALLGESVHFCMTWQNAEYEVFLEPIRQASGEIAGAMGITIDITEQRLQSDALKRSEERYRLLSEHSPIGIWQTDLDGKTIYMNPAMCELLQLRCISEGFGESYRNYLSLESRKKLNGHMRDAGKLQRIEVEIIGRLGRSRTVILTSVPVFEGEEKICGQLHTFLDITEQKRNDDEKRRVESRIRNLQKVESLERLAEGIAHDFNNLLLGVVGNAGLASLEVGPNSRAAFRLEQVKRAAEQAADLTKQLFRYSGRHEPQRKVLHISSEVEEICRLLEAALEKKARLILDLSISLPPIEADATQIRQVIINLVTNAGEAFGPNHGQITIRTGLQEQIPPDVQEDFSRRTSHTGPFVFLEVQDAGCGMDKETLTRMFDPFFSTKPLIGSEGHENTSSRGFGLAAVLSAVKSHGGGISVRSQIDQGTTVRVYFPARPGLATPPRKEREMLARKLPKDGHGVVLVVDDDPIVQEVAQVSLEKFGYHVVVAKDGQQALNELETLKNLDILKQKGLPIEGVIAVLLDLTMPVLDGEGVLRQLEKRFPQLPVILSSGYSKEGISQRIRMSLSSSTDRPLSENGLLVGNKLKFLQKPYRPTALIEMLQTLT